MIRLYWFIFIVLLFGNCDSSKTSKEDSPDKKDTTSAWVYLKDTTSQGAIIYRPNFSLVKIDTSQIKLDFFDSIPETISTKMGGFYTYDTTKLSKNKYIFLTDLTSYAVIRVNGRDVYVE